MPYDHHLFRNPLTEGALSRLNKLRNDAERSKRPSWKDIRSQRHNPFLRKSEVYWEHTENPQVKQWGDTRYTYSTGAPKCFRLVGDADKIIRLDHTGWYMDDECGAINGTAKGVVFQLVGKNGEPRFFPAIDQSENNEIVTFPLEVTDDKEEAARWADHYADKWAERSREFYAEDRRERQIEDLEEEISQMRSEIKELRIDRKKNQALIRELKYWPRPVKVFEDMIQLLLEKSANLHHQIEVKEKERDQLQD
ncbi:hypothetical protein Phage2-1_00085 [Achromobacter phage 2-1]|nr:hypothetical protein Phage2-1_00085 [Achromobacter phage 2-1]